MATLKLDFNGTFFSYTTKKVSLWVATKWLLLL